MRTISLLCRRKSLGSTDVLFFAELARVKKMSAQQAWELWGQLLNLVFYLL